MAKFGTSGIRGKLGSEITPELAMRLGACISAKGSHIAIARDGRASGQLLENALASGVMASGGAVVRIGVAPTPTLALAAKRHCATGVMITASHNPPEYNGFKLFNTSGEEIGRGEEQRIEKQLAGNVKYSARWDEMGGEIADKGAGFDHAELVLRNVDAVLIRERAPKVLVDCGNGAASTLMPYVLRIAGCKVVAVNSEPSGVFARGLEPNEENLRETAAMVKAAGADLGIAHDGDADRAVAIDDTGKLLGLDVQLALMCEEELRQKKGTVVSTIEAGLCVKEAVERAGGKFEMTKVGSAHVAREMRHLKAVFGGEPCGEYIFAGGVPVPDGILTGLKLVEMFCRRGKLSALAAKVKAYPMKRAKFPATDREKAMAKIAPEIRKAFKGRYYTEDGIRVDFDGGWLLVRASGTEPIIRITAEAKSEKQLAEIYSRAEGIVKKYLG